MDNKIIGLIAVVLCFIGAIAYVLFVEGAALIKLGDKISNVTDVTDNPPADWDINRRREYLDWAEKVVGNCPQVNERMENKFQEVVNNGRKQLV